MKKILALAILLMLLVVSAWAQPIPSSTPPSPESLGIQAPTPTSSTQAPPSSESGQTLMATSESSARAAAPSTITVNSNSIRGYSVYVDGNYVGGDGRGNPRDGSFSFSVSGNQQHTIRVYSNGFSYSQTRTYSCGNSYTVRV